MTAAEIAALLNAQIVAEGDAARQVSGCMACDVMSRSIAQGFSGMAWLTSQAQINALAVAVLKDAACLILTDGAQPDERMLTQAAKERVCVLATDRNMFEAAGLMYRAGLRGKEI